MFERHFITLIKTSLGGGGGGGGNIDMKKQWMFYLTKMKPKNLGSRQEM